MLVNGVIGDLWSCHVVADRYNRMACRRRALYVSFRDLGWQVRSVKVKAAELVLLHSFAITVHDYSV